MHRKRQALDVQVPAASPARGKWNAYCQVWVEHDGQTVLGPTEFALLERVAATGSISEAARQLGISYRRAWGIVQQVNRAAGEPFVDTAAGGHGGGGAELTRSGRQALANYRRIADRAQAVVEPAGSDLTEPGPELIESAKEPTIAAATSLGKLMNRLALEYMDTHPGVMIHNVFGATSDMARQILAGSPADLFVSADERQMDRLERARAIEPGSRVDLVGNHLVMICPSDRELEIRRPRDVLQPSVHRIALAHPGAALGYYTRAYLQGQRLYADMLQRAVLLDSAAAVLTAVDSGWADLGIVFQTDSRVALASRVVYKIPVKHHPPIACPCAILRGSGDSATAKSLWEFLQSPEARERFHDAGFVVFAKPRRKPVGDRVRSRETKSLRG